MTHDVIAATLAADRFGRIRNLLELVRQAERLLKPIASADDLAAAIDALVSLADALGVSPDWLDRLRPILVDPALRSTLWAVLQLVLHRATAVADADAVRITASRHDEWFIGQASFVDWLPIVLKLLDLLRQLRGQA